LGRGLAGEHPDHRPAALDLGAWGALLSACRRWCKWLVSCMTYRRPLSKKGPPHWGEEPRMPRRWGALLRASGRQGAPPERLVALRCSIQRQAGFGHRCGRLSPVCQFVVSLALDELVMSWLGLLGHWCQGPGGFSNSKGTPRRGSLSVGEAVVHVKPGAVLQVCRRPDVWCVSQCVCRWRHVRAWRNCWWGALLAGAVIGGGDGTVASCRHLGGSCRILAQCLPLPGGGPWFFVCGCRRRPARMGIS